MIKKLLKSTKKLDIPLDNKSESTMKRLDTPIDKSVSSDSGEDDKKSKFANSLTSNSFQNRRDFSQKIKKEDKTEECETIQQPFEEIKE